MLGSLWDCSCPGGSMLGTMAHWVVTGRMSGIYALVAAVLFLLLLAVADRNKARFTNRVLLRVREFLHSSRKTYFALYFTSLVFIAISFNLFVGESGDRFLQEAFTWPIQLFIWLNMTALVVLYSLGRFRRKMTEEERFDALLRVFEETVERAPTPAEGIDHVLEYITEYRDEFPHEFPRDIPGRFLAYLSKRDDAIGREARERCKTIQ